MSKVKFSVSSGDDEMPADDCVGYSQSMSIPSRPKSRTARTQSATNDERFFSEAAISLNRPLPQPPMLSMTFSEGFWRFRPTIMRKRSGLSMRSPSNVSLTCPKA